MIIRVGNIKRGDKGEYIGRASRGRKKSPLANDYRVATHRHGRANAIEYYRNWLRCRMIDHDAVVLGELARLAALAQRPEGVTLLCWCSPLACHGDVVAELMREMEE